MSLKNQHYEHMCFIQSWYRPFDTLWLGQAILMCWHGEMTSLKLPFQSIGKPSSSMKLFQNWSDHKNCGYCGTKLAYHASLQRASRKKSEVLPLSLIMKMMMFILTCWERTYPVPRHFWRWFSFSNMGYVIMLVLGKISDSVTRVFCALYSVKFVHDLPLLILIDIWQKYRSLSGMEDLRLIWWLKSDLR